jgi:hypothetical protein
LIGPSLRWSDNGTSESRDSLHVVEYIEMVSMMCLRTDSGNFIYERVK